MWVNGFGHLNKTNLQTIKEKQNEQISFFFFFSTKKKKKKKKKKIKKNKKKQNTTLKTVEKKEW